MIKVESPVAPPARVIAAMRKYKAELANLIRLEVKSHRERQLALERLDEAILWATMGLVEGGPRDPLPTADDYHYDVAWSDEDKVFIARVVEFPSLGAHGSTEDEALAQIHSVVSAILLDMTRSGEHAPHPYQGVDEPAPAEQT